MNIAVFTTYKELLNNKLFELAEGTMFNRDSSERYAALKQFLLNKGIRINTFDCYGSVEEIHGWLFIDPPAHIDRFIDSYKIPWEKRMLMMVEPPVGNPQFYQWIGHYSRLLELFSSTLTWNSELCRVSERFFQFHYPLGFEISKYNEYISERKKNLCLMMHSNKTSTVSGELYSLRRKIIRSFGLREDSLLDLYGFGWNDERSHNPFFTRLYKGTVADKRKTYSQYYFAFCIDNCIIPGYITYDPFIAMATGTVPVYLPMPDSAQYIPEDTFIDFSKYPSGPDLIDKLQEVVRNGEYYQYRQRGWDFINSDRYKPFTVMQFCQNVYHGIKKTLNYDA